MSSARMIRGEMVDAVDALGLIEQWQGFCYSLAELARRARVGYESLHNVKSGKTKRIRAVDMERIRAVVEREARAAPERCQGDHRRESARGYLAIERRVHKIAPAKAIFKRGGPGLGGGFVPGTPVCPNCRQHVKHSRALAAAVRAQSPGIGARLSLEFDRHVRACRGRRDD